jgi:hypothetical protein
VPELDQPGLAAKLEPLREKLRQGSKVLLAKAGDAVMVRVLIPDR